MAPPNTNSNGIGDMFLLVKGAKHGLIKGESQDTQHKDEIDVLSWSWGMQGKPSLGGGAASGKASMHDLKITKRVDSAMLWLTNRPQLEHAAKESGWRFGRPFVVRHCRVGIMNDIGDILKPEVLVLLIGERPGLATSESLSAYLAFRPRAGHSDAHRNLISNIHARGIDLEHAVSRIMALSAQMRLLERSGVDVREELALGAKARFVSPTR